MGEWIAIAQWHECEQMARPGIVFELRNSEGQSLITPCVAQLPPTPFDWKSPPVMFRTVPRRHRNVQRRCQLRAVDTRYEFSIL